MRLYHLFHIIARNACDPADKVAKYKVVRSIIDAIRDGYLEILDNVSAVYEDIDLVEAYIAGPERQLEEPERHLREIMEYPEVANNSDESEDEEEEEPDAPKAPKRAGNLLDTLLLLANTVMLAVFVTKNVIIV